MRFSRKEKQDSRKKSISPTINVGNETIEAIFIPQITDMHGIPFEEGEIRNCGRGWHIDPAYGKGTYWYLPIDDSIALAVFELLFYEDVAFSAQVPNFFCFGNYGYNMIPYFAPFIDIDEGWERGTLLGYAWRNGKCTEVAKAQKHLTVTSISLLPQAATSIAHTIGCDPLTLTSAIASLNGTYRILPLLTAFEEIRQAQLSSLVAQSFYECKIVEACILLVNWWEQHIKDAAPRIRPADRTAFNLACTYAREHLSEPISLEDLCHVSCVSASKLTSLFKSIENVTPLQYVRDRRMEQACELLSNSDDSLSDIARQIGFVRQGSFSEAFKDRFGITPHQYRKMNH